MIDRVPAVGGERTVPAPDAVARAYLHLALRLDRLDPGIVDGYFGPADLKAAVDLEQPRPRHRLVDDLAVLGTLVAGIAEPDRRAWLEAQLIAIETRLAVLAGDRPAYLDEVERSFAIRPTERPEELFDDAAAEIDDLLPGSIGLAERLAAFDASTTIAPDRLPAVMGWLLGELRRRSEPRFGIPAGESVRVGFVTRQPWSGYDWYDGGLRSRVDINTDLPTRAPELLDMLAHETYAGHHLEHAWKEAELVEAAGRLEHSVLLLSAPECLISEGLADLGPDLLLGDGRAELLTELLVAGGVAATPALARPAAERAVALRASRIRLGEVRVNAAIQRWSDGTSSDATLAYLSRVGRIPDARARKALEFIEHPRWRTYVHVYHEGKPLLRRWVDAAPDGDRDARFRRLLREPLTPGAILAELALADLALADPA